MPAVVPIQASFSGGVISPRLRGRVDADVYRAALAACSNFIPSAQGSGRTRPGARFAFPIRTFYVPELGGDPVDVTSERRLRSVPMAGREGYLLAFGEKTVSAMSADTLVEHAGEILEVRDSELFEADFDTEAGWTKNGAGPYFGAATVLEGTPETCVQISGEEWVAHTFTVVNAGKHLVRFTFPVFHPNGLGDVHWGGLAANAIIEVWIGSDSSHHELFEWSKEVGAVSSGTTRNVSYCFEVTLPAGTHTFSCGRRSNATGFDCALTGVSIQRLGYVNRETPWTDAQLDDLYTCPLVVEGLDGLIVCHAETFPRFLAIDAYGRWACTEPTFTNVPAEWGVNNYPRVCLMFQNRIWFGSTPAQPDMFWASKPAPDYLSFDFGDSTKESDAFSFRLGVRQEIRWMAAYQRVLVMGTETGEYIISSESGAISPVDIDARFESNFGSAARPAALIGGQALYASRDRRKLRAMNFAQQRQAWESQDVTLRAEHVTAKQIDEFAFVRDPESQLVVLLDDGRLVSATYLPETGVVAWWTVESELHVQSIAVTEGDSSRLWLIDDNHNLHFLTFADVAGDCYADGWVERVIQEDQSLVDLEHLAGESVYAIPTVLSGGAMPLPFLVDIEEDGTVVLPQSAGDPGDTILVGLGTSAAFETLPPEAGGLRGSSQNAKKQWASVKLRLNDSALPTVNGETPPSRLVTPATGRMTGDAVVNSLGSGDGHLHVVQALPLRTEVLAIFGVLSASEV